MSVSKSRLSPHAVLERIQGFIALCDESGWIVYINSAAKTLSKSPQVEDIVGRPDTARNA